MKNKIKLIIFSKNRANQLQCLLSSLEKNSTIFNDIYILYKFTNDEYKEGYDKLKNDVYTNISKNKSIYFYEENEEGFKSNLNELLELNREKYDHICFMVDDQILYQKLYYEDKICGPITDDVFCFSLRLGENVTYRHLTDSYFKVKNYQKIIDLDDDISDYTFIKWNWREQEIQSDFGYPLSVDGHIFRYEDIEKLIKPLNYHNPNTLEASLQLQLNFPKNYMISYGHSKMVNLPINRVNDVFNNRFGTKVNISEKELNDKFLNGEIIDYEKLDYKNINSCHVEIPLVFKKELEYER